MFIGVAIMILSMPINATIARFQTRMSKQQMKNKDQRTRLMNEILNNIRSIKLYSEAHAMRHVEPTDTLQKAGRMRSRNVCSPSEMTRS